MDMFYKIQHLNFRSLSCVCHSGSRLENFHSCFKSSPWDENMDYHLAVTKLQRKKLFIIFWGSMGSGLLWE
jgi:hypothetical protein